MNIQRQIYWHTTIRMPGDEHITALPRKVDVAIIGGGYTGLSAARTLAMQGARVAVLEAETMGWGASSRNGGMVLTGLKLGMQTIQKLVGLHSQLLGIGHVQGMLGVDETGNPPFFLSFGDDVKSQRSLPGSFR